METSHEKFWKGDFGDKYTDRNRCGKSMIACRVGNLAKCLSRADYLNSSLEFGSNIGYNEIALRQLYPDIEMDVVEINEKAAEECGKIENVKVHNTSVYDFKREKQYDLTLVNVTYRGYDGQLCKRDFAGEMLDKYPDLRLLDYGFIYHRDSVFPMDDFNWFLLEKNKLSF